MEAMRIAVAGATGLIGGQVVARARAAGHEVVELSRSRGVDLTTSEGIGDRLAGVGAVIDVTRSSDMDPTAATDFFTTVARNLGTAAHAARVPRTVVLSIVGVERARDYGWYAATLAHERATRAYAPGPVVVQATQFHEFPGQVLDRSSVGHAPGTEIPIMDMPTQPVESAEVARLLYERAVARDGADAKVAGPTRHRLPALVEQVARLRGWEVRIAAVPAVPSVAAGAVLPDKDAILTGCEWSDWADAAAAAGTL